MPSILNKEHRSQVALLRAALPFSYGNLLEITQDFGWMPVAPAARAQVGACLLALGYQRITPTFYMLEESRGPSFFISLIPLPSAARRMDNLDFYPLATVHMPLLSFWMQQPHVQTWWPSDPSQMVRQYEDQIQGYRQIGTLQKKIQSFIIVFQGWPIGYIQQYDVRDFAIPSAPVLTAVPGLCAGLDWYIGFPAFLGKGLGRPVLQKFMERWIWPHFSACLVDPDVANKRAIHVYAMSNFHPIALDESSGATHWMLALRPPVF